MSNRDVDLSNFSGENREVEVVDKKIQFSKTPAYVLCDNSISGLSKAILGYVILRKGNPEHFDWDLYKQDITNQMKETKTAVTTAFNNLIDRGYLIQSETFKDEKRGHTRRYYRFYVDPFDNEFYDGGLPENEFYDNVLKLKNRVEEGDKRRERKTEFKDTYNKNKQKKSASSGEKKQKQIKTKQTNTKQSVPKKNDNTRKNTKKTSNKWDREETIGDFDFDDFD